MPTLRYGFKRPARGDRPPLMVAAEYDAAPAVATLVAAGADVDHKFEGTTAVKVAASRGHAAALEALLAHGADPTFKPIAGRTALWDAAAGGHARCIDLLLDAGARDLNTRSLFSYTALWIALLHGHLEATRTLLRRGATIHRHLAGHLGPAPRWETPMTLVADRLRKEAERREQYGRYFKWGESPETLDAMRACADLVSDALAAAGGSWSATRRIVKYWPLGPNKHFPSEDFVSYWSGPDGSSTVWPSYVRAARARLVALRALCAAGRARPLASAPSELAWIFAAHDDGRRRRTRRRRRRAAPSPTRSSAASVSSFAPAPQRRHAMALHISDAGDLIAKFERDNGGKVFEKLVEYPCEFTIKVIGKHEDSFAGDMVGYISKTVDVAPEKIKFTTTPSGKGTYTSVTIEAPVASADQLYECYAVLRNDPRVRMAL
ncbi:DUF493-like protein [Aureococcus anophagefferens]|nr:DUF493-like protein [Aureococcus anophagefferens]